MTQPHHPDEGPQEPVQPPYQPMGWQAPPPAKPKAPLLLGMLIGAVVPVLGFVISGVLTSVSDAFQLAPFAWTFLVLLTGAGLLFPDRTRRWGVGILLGLFGMLIVGAGVCVAALVVVLSTWNGG